jgi:hypothetical protein
MVLVNSTRQPVFDESEAEVALAAARRPEQQ